MSQPAVRIEGLGKQYRLGSGQRPAYQTLRDTIGDTASGVVRALRGQRAPRDARDVATFWALRDVSFEVAEGEVVGIIGRNGAGKSTLLKILSRITEPTQGYADIYGRVGSLLEVGTGFHPELSGRENVFLNGAILGMRRAETQRKFDEIVAFSEVEKFIDTPVKHYSSGMYLRLAFAVAAHLEPDILVVDEVLAVGDMQFQKKCLGKMQDVSETGRTILFVSHNMSAITSLCSRTVLLEAGQVLRIGPSTDIVKLYLANATGAAATATWADLTLAPGQGGFKLSDVRLTGAAGQSIAVVNVEQPLMLEIGYHVSEPGLSFRIAASFHTQGACAFVTLEPHETIRERAGFYVAHVPIPENFLAEGDYSVSLSIFSSRGKKMHLCKLNDVLVFQVFDPVSGNSARGDYTEGLAGVMRPLLPWHTTCVGDRPLAQRCESKALS